MRQIAFFSSATIRTVQNGGTQGWDALRPLLALKVTLAVTTQRGIPIATWDAVFALYVVNVTRAVLSTQSVC